MTFFKTLFVALSTYSALPVPQFEWNEKNMRYAICCFPVVGILCAAALLLWNWLCGWLGVGSVLFAAVATCLPLLITGGIHMDGYMDTVDALASHQSRERKLEIMKDPSCGAFAVIYCGIYLLLQFGLFYAIFEEQNVAVLAGAYVFSRAMSGLCAVTMPNARGTGMLCSFTTHACKQRSAGILVLLAVLAAVGMLWYAPVCGGCTLVCGLLCMLLYRRMADKQFGGATGDTAGFFLQVCELCMLLGVWVGGLL